MISRFSIPRINEGCYLGGLAALNIPGSGASGDWHLQQTFFRPRRKLSRSFISGEGCPTNTNKYFGSEGIYDCTAILDELSIPYESAPVFAASHIRAAADLVIDAVSRGLSPDFVVLDDWLPLAIDKAGVFELLERAEQYMPVDQQEAVRKWKDRNA
jgi:hypothetical protein